MDHHAEKTLSAAARRLKSLARSLTPESERAEGPPPEAAAPLSELQALTLLGRLLQLQIDQAARNAYRAGASYAALGDAAGLSPAGARGRWAAREAARSPGRRPALTEHDLERALRRRAAGETVSSIADDLGVDRSTLYRALRQSPDDPGRAPHRPS